MLYIFFVTIVAVLFPLGLAQGSSVSAEAAQTSTSTSSAPASTHTVSVGAAGLVFTPNQITADVGDIIEFLFYPQNHSVARSEYKSPCIPYEDTGVNKQGFWSGFHPVSVVLPDPPKFHVLINDTNPVFFYCSAPGACIEDGMIGVINPNSTETFNTQLAFAKNSTLMFSPGEYFPAEIASTSSATASSSSTSSTSSSTPTTSASASASASQTPAAAASSHSTLSTGAIAGIAIGGAAVLVIAGALIYLCGRQRTMGELLRQSHSVTPSYIPGHLSMSSGGVYSPKIPQIGIDAVPGRYSAQGGFYDRSPAETESYRSRSPPMEESRDRESMIPPINLGGSPGNLSPERTQSPLRRPVPVSPERTQSPLRRPVPVSPLRPSPTTTTHDPIYQPLHMDLPPALRINRYNSQRGPHELSVESEPVYPPNYSLHPRQGNPRNDPS